MIEVCLFTALFGLAMHALGGLVSDNGDVDAPGQPGVRDYMLRYMAEVFVGGSLGATVGHICGGRGELGVRVFAALGGEHGDHGFDRDFVFNVARPRAAVAFSKAE